MNAAAVDFARRAGDRAPAASRPSSALVAIVALAAAPAWAARADMRLLGEIFSYLALASLWNLLAGYAGLVSVGQQAYVGFGGYMLFAFAIFVGVHPLLAIVARRRARRADRGARGASASSACPVPISPSAPGSSPKSSGSASRKSQRSAAAPASACRPAIVTRHRRRPRPARMDHLLGGA